MTDGVAMAFCYGGSPEGLFNESLVRLLIHDANNAQRITKRGDVISLNSGPRIASSRNQMTRVMLEHPKQPDWLWMVDADMTFRPDTLDRMVQTARANQCLILGALCFGGGRSGTMFPTLYQLQAPDESGAMVKVIEDYPEDSLVRVDATGAACLLIHRSVLTKMLGVFGEVDTPKGRVKSPAPWFAETFYGGREFGEDWTFCMRAAQLEIPIHVHTGIAVGHVKQWLLDETTWGEFKAKREAMGGKDAVIADWRMRALGSI